MDLNLNRNTQMPNQPKKKPRGRPRRESDPIEPEFRWLRTLEDFRVEHNLSEIDSLEDPNVYRIDQYLILAMDSLKEWNADLLEVTERSAMRLLYIVVEDSARNTPPEKMQFKRFYELLCDRLREDLELVYQFNSSEGLNKVIARQKLWQRGLLR
jgi:hypothetical protein